MSYRDDLGQAHERIRQLEGELREERGANAAPRERRGRVAAIAIAMAVLAVGVAGGVVAFVGLRRPPTSTIDVRYVDEVVRDQARHRGVFMRVQGTLVPGTTKKRTEPCEVTLVIERKGVLLTVHVPHCSLPDLFRPDAEIPVVAEGELQADGVFEAKQILVRVPDF